MSQTSIPPRSARRAYRRFDVAIRQGTAGGRPAQESDRQGTEVGLSPMAYIAGSAAEMMRLPTPWPDLRGFGGDYPHFADLALGKVPGRTRDDQITFYITTLETRGLQFSSVGVAVYRKARAQGPRLGAGTADGLVRAGHPGLGNGVRPSALASVCTHWGE
jgi:hypothetical protein